MIYSNEMLKKYGDFFEIDFLRPYNVRKTKKNPLKNLVIADVHAPFHDKEVLESILDKEQDCKDLFIVGDMWDMYSKSFYRKQMSVDFPKEYRIGFNLLQRFAEMFDTVYLMVSNHDDRFKKWIFDNIHPDLIDFTDYNVLTNLLETIPNLKLLQQKTTTSRIIGYVCKYKNVVFTHVEKSYKDVGKVVQEVEKELLVSGWAKKMNLGNYDGVIQAHNHTSCKIRSGNDKFLFQIPCLIDIDSAAFNYVFNGKIQGHPPSLGYILLYENSTGTEFDLLKSQVVDIF